MALIPDISLFIPELILLIGILSLILIGSFLKKESFRWIYIGSTSLLCIVFLAVVFSCGKSTISFGGQWIHDPLSVFSKGVILIGTFIIILVGESSWSYEKIKVFEYPILLLLATLGMMLMVSAFDLLALFVALELQSLTLYILTSLKRQDRLCAEAALKYFVLGALSTCLLLYGIGLVYGFSGTTNFDVLNRIYASEVDSYLGMTIGIGFIIVGFAFKLAIVPFHMWAPDVYQGTPTTVTTFLASVPKIAALCMMIRFFGTSLVSVVQEWQFLLIVLSLLSLFLGALGALRQNSIKRLLAYSSVHNMGFVLLGFIIGQEDGLKASLFYMVIYVITVIGIFFCLLNIERRGQKIDAFDDLKGLIRFHSGTAFVLCFLFFSLAGIPPLVGFLAKASILQSLVKVEYYGLAVVVVLSSVIAAAYYLKVIKIIIMDAPQIDEKGPLVYRQEPLMTSALIVILATLGYLFIQPTPLLGTISLTIRSLV